MSEHHTPGPWRIYEGDNLIVCFGDGDSICDAAPGSPFVSWDAARANTRLIAAAPDLLAALQEIIARNEIQHWFNLDQARAAVAKATLSTGQRT